MLDRLTSVFGSNEMHISHILAASLDVMMNGIGCNAADFHQPIVLNKNCITG